MIARAIRTRLAAYSGLTALVSTRIYTVQAPQSATVPFVTVQALSTRRFSAMGADTGDAVSRVQVSAWADKYDNATTGVRQVAAQIVAALQRYSGTSASVTISDVFVEGESDQYDPDPRTGIYHVPIDAMVWHKE